MRTSSNYFCAATAKTTSAIAVIIIAFIITGCASDQADWHHTTWQAYGGGPDQSKYVVQNEITKENVDQLEVAWVYETADNGRHEMNPIIINEMMIVKAKGNSLVALDVATGEEIWIHTNLRGITRRGINYWESEDGSDRRILFLMNDYLQALDAETGESILDFGNNGLVDLKQDLPPRAPETMSGVQSGFGGQVFENLYITGSATGESYMSAPGHIRAYDILTGDLVWRFNTIPQPGEYGYDTWPEDAYKYIGGTNVWSEISVDEERGIGYFPTGSPTYDFYGADRIGANLFGNSLIALDLRTGERLWHFQLLHHDLLDYDLASAPQLVTVNHDGEEIDAVAVATKYGYLFAFNRVNGEPLWPIEERPAPQSTVPGEESWPTQPHPTVLPPFSKQTMSLDDLSTILMSEEDRAEWAQRIALQDSLGRNELFTPLSHEYETFTVPGVQGGANYGSTAANPEAGMVYVISSNWPSVYPPLIERDFQPQQDENSGPGGGGGRVNPAALGADLYMANCSSCHAVDWSGSGNSPALIGIETRLNFADFQFAVMTGRGEMPGFSNLDEDEIMAIYRYLGGSASGEVAALPEGPVVATGGAPGSSALRPSNGGGQLGQPYPEDSDAPDIRYYSQSYGDRFQFIMRTPWATITAYDLNEGSIKWQVPLGVDDDALAEGAEDTGSMRSTRRGMIVTSNGLLFATSRDGRFYAFDADTGDELWSSELPMVPEGLPAMYEFEGRQYIVVSATVPASFGPSDPSGPQPSYVVFSLPE